MAHAERRFFKKYHGQGLFQVALLGTALAALRVLQSPSTLTFFVFEAAGAATLGILLAQRDSDASRRQAASHRNRSAPQGDADDSPPLERLKTLALRLGLNPNGSVEDLRRFVRFAALSRVDPPARTASLDEPIGRALVDRIAPIGGTDSTGFPGSPLALNDSLSSQAREASRLFALAQDLGVPSAPVKQILRKARRASQTDQVDRAVMLLENGNRRLRARLSALIERDMNGNTRAPDRIYLAASTAFFVMIAMAVLALSTGLYVPPASFHVFAAGTAGVTAWNAYSSGSRRPTGVLLQIVLLATLLKFHFFFLNPYLYTSDTFFHFRGVLGIAVTGRIPESLGHYAFFPVHHVFGFIGASALGLPITWYGLFAFLAQLMAVPAAFLIGREISGPRVGLFAAFLTMFSVFFFLPTIPLPSLFGFVFVFLALYALVTVRRTATRAWLGVFWISALAAFFSHPITALVLLLALLFRFAFFQLPMRKKSDTRGSSFPFLSYGVAYGGYLAFIATVSFQTFLGAIFGQSYAPPLATSPASVLQVSSLFVLESAIAPAGIGILVFFAAYGMLSETGISSVERRFLSLLAVAFILIPAFEFILENFRGQSTRFTSYIVIPLVLVGAHGAVRLHVATRARGGTGRVVIALLVACAFLSTSTYLTNNDARYLYSDVPAIPTHITESALASRDFLTFLPEESFVYMDFGSWIYFLENDQRARNALLELHTSTLDNFDGTRQAFVVVNEHFIAYGNPYEGTLLDVSAILARLEDAQASRLYDAGAVQIYLVS